MIVLIQRIVLFFFDANMCRIFHLKRSLSIGFAVDIGLTLMQTTLGFDITMWCFILCKVGRLQHTLVLFDVGYANQNEIIFLKNALCAWATAICHLPRSISLKAWST